MKAVLVAFLCGACASQSGYLQAKWFVWSFLILHVVGVWLLSDMERESGVLALCAAIGLHAGHAASECILWLLARDGDGSLGTWSVLVVFSSVLYLYNFCAECVILPPSYVTSLSLFFTTYPAYNFAIVVSCLEYYLEWWYFPRGKIWYSVVSLGVVLMVAGQYLIISTCRVAERNFWASCQYEPEEDEDDDAAGLEIPNRDIVEEGPYRWERHPSYLGAMLWGIGAELALCNPMMLLVVAFVLWAALLHITMEEEKELIEEFEGAYHCYSTLTASWIPFFNRILEATAFQREMTELYDVYDSDEESDASDEVADEGEESEPEAEAEVEEAEENLLPLWGGIKSRGAVWNRQFRDPWRLG